ncbi:golgin subfamily B member 1 [Anoplophora glabripennis]|nr:golgin subfamily B member 1 [Anoplophora glabripennis]XP_018577327.1 golgin subfamily B member 1 [Anoplophora glabripennis]
MVTLPVFFVLSVAVISRVQAAVTNEDIRIAILQIVNVVRATDDKLERHEYRDRVVGEQLKKGMINIDKRIKMLDPLKGTVSRLDERLADVETLLMQKEEREKIQQQKTYDVVLDIQKNLPVIMEQIKNDILDKIQSNTPPAQIIEPVISKKDFEKLEKQVLNKMDKVTTTIDNMENELLKIRDDNKNMNDINNKSSENLEKVKRQLDTSEQLLAKYETKLAEYNNKIPEIPLPNYKEEEEWKHNFLKVLESQKSQVKEILSDVKTLKHTLDALPQKSDIEDSQNVTLEKLEEIKQENTLIPEKTAELIQVPLNNIQDDLESKSNETMKSINELLLIPEKTAQLIQVPLNNIQDAMANKSNETMKNINELFDITVTLTERFSNNYEKIRAEIQALGKLEQVMLRTADDVLDTKRRVEYGVHQILAEVSKQVKDSTKDINQGINERFDSFELSILDEDSGALANLTSKIGEEIDQVWRQIGIMHQQMSASTDTLNKLQNQTDAYVNGSVNVMDSMKGKVGLITAKITEVEDNLNYLLGRLSLVTQEFNHIKTGLGKALDEIKDSFNAVQDKINENKGPGPHKIDSGEVGAAK